MQALKRGLDFLVALGLLMLLSPLLVAVGILIFITMGSPVLFTQQRPGLNGNPFFIYKFRTMGELRDADKQLLPDEARLTWVGRLLRSTSIDELPQLVNVLKGELSFVGPRPLLMEYLPLYSLHQARRHLVKPGITGWAQVHGRNAITWESKFNYDVWYVDHQSFWLDLKIMIMTVGKVFKQEGIDMRGEQGPFQGSK